MATLFKREPKEWGGWERFTDLCDDPQYLADLLIGWRETLKITAATAAELLGLPVRTLNGIEQGRGFRYPRMLVNAVLKIGDDWKSAQATLKAEHKKTLQKELAIMRKVAPQYAADYEKALSIVENEDEVSAQLDKGTDARRHE